MVWEYLAVDVSNPPSRMTVADLLNQAGKDGWELVTITANMQACFKRPVVRPRSSKPIK